MMSDPARLLAQLEDRSLPPADFNHLGHVMAAWQALEEEQDFGAALSRYSRALKAYAASLDAAGKYNETVTVFFLSLIHRHRCETPDASWEAFRSAAPALFDAPDQLLRRHYSSQLLGASLSRECFLMPDLPVSGTAA